MQTHYLLGLDGGGTKTDALLCTADGEVKARCTAGPSSLTGQSEESAFLQIRTVLTGVLSPVGGLDAVSYTHLDVYKRQGADSIELRTMNALTQEAQAFDAQYAFDWPHLDTALEADSEYGSTLHEIVAEALAQLIVTTGDVEAEYAAFVERWENEGGLEWEEEATQAYAGKQAE